MCVFLLFARSIFAYSVTGLTYENEIAENFASGEKEKDIIRMRSWRGLALSDPPKSRCRCLGCIVETTHSFRLRAAQCVGFKVPLSNIESTWAAGMFSLLYDIVGTMCISADCVLYIGPMKYASECFSVGRGILHLALTNNIRNIALYDVILEDGSFTAI